MGDGKNPIDIYNSINEKYFKDGGIDYNQVCSFLRKNKQTAFPYLKEEVKKLESIAQHPTNIRVRAFEFHYKDIIENYESMQKNQGRDEKMNAEKELFKIYFNCISNKF